MRRGRPPRVLHFPTTLARLFCRAAMPSETRENGKYSRCLAECFMKFNKYEMNLPRRRREWRKGERARARIHTCTRAREMKR